MCSESILYPIHPVSPCQGNWLDEQFPSPLPFSNFEYNTESTVHTSPSSLLSSCTNFQNAENPRCSVSNSVTSEPNFSETLRDQFQDKSFSHNVLVQPQLSFPEAETTGPCVPFPTPPFMSLEAFGIDVNPTSGNDDQYSAAFVDCSVTDGLYIPHSSQDVLAMDSDVLIERDNADFLFTDNEVQMPFKTIDWHEKLKPDFGLEDAFQAALGESMAPQVPSIPYSASTYRYPLHATAYATVLDAEESFTGAVNSLLQLTEEDSASPFDEGAQSYRDVQDEFLITSKMAGMSYKEIKAKGQFKQAESTLRGRFRTLTKTKDRRVRKPKWQEKDIQLLRQIVSEQYKAIAAENASLRRKRGSETKDDVKISWKEVSEFIALHGSYQFGNATCRRKWNEIKDSSI